MTKKLNPARKPAKQKLPPAVWAARAKFAPGAPFAPGVRLFSRRPKRKLYANGPCAGAILWESDHLLLGGCADMFARYTGLDLEPGECVRVRFPAEVV